MYWPFPSPCSAVKTALAALAPANPTIYEFCAHLDATNKTIMASLATASGGQGVD
jgi:hypothetical protein